MNPNELILGKNSYPAIVAEIFSKIQTAKADTLTGSSLLSEIYSELKESITPMLTLKPFITKAEKLASDDLTVGEIIKLIKDKTGSADLNFIINLCKEEHFENLNRMNHPSPESTVKEIEHLFDKPASVIEEGIKNGLYDSLKSNLLGKIKQDLKVPEFKVLNESAPVFAGISQNIIKYNPVGLRFDDVKNNKIVMLCESSAFVLDAQSKKFSKMNESDSNIIPDSYKMLMGAINALSYDPKDNSFTLGLQWDFDLIMSGDGVITINSKVIPESKVKNFLIESINVYQNDPTKIPNFVKPNYEKDADNFIMVMNNQKSLIKFDNLESIRNLNENSLVLVDKNTVYANTPEILFSSKGDYVKTFESYTELAGHVNSVLNTNLNENFAPQLKNEQQLIATRNQKIVELNESQKELNRKIISNKNLMTLAEVNSPAMVELMENDNKLNSLLKANIDDINHYVNDFKMY